MLGTCNLKITRTLYFLIAIYRKMTKVWQISKLTIPVTSNEFTSATCSGMARSQNYIGEWGGGDEGQIAEGYVWLDSINVNIKLTNSVNTFISS